MDRHPLPPTTYFEQSWHLADVDQDGDQDVILDRHARFGEVNQWHLVGVLTANRESTLFDLPVTYRLDGETLGFSSIGGYFVGVPGADLVLYDNTAGAKGQPRVYAYRVGDSTLDYAVDHPTMDEPWGEYELLHGDIDGDGRQDLIWNRLAENNDVIVGFGRPDELALIDRKQRQPWTVADWAAYEHLMVLDVDGDGRDDLLWNQPGPTNRIFVGVASSAL